VRALFGVLSVVFLTVAVRAGWDDIRAVEGIGWSSVVPATALQIVASVALARSWSEALPSTAPRRESVRRFLIVQPAKYIPGGIAQPLGQIGSVADLGVAWKEATAASLLHLVGTVAAGGLLSVFLVGAGDSIPRWVVSSVAASVVAGVLLVVLALQGRLVRVLVRVGARLPGRFTEFRPRSTTSVVAWAVVAIGLMAVAYLLLCRGLGIDLPASVGVGAFALAWLFGFLALPFPAGIGVREALLVGSLGAWGPASLVVSVALVHRFLQMIAEGLLMVVARMRPK
jgi:hypothetical protein